MVDVRPLSELLVNLPDDKLIRHINTIFLLKKNGEVMGNTEVTIEAYRAEFSRRGLTFPTEEQ